MFKAGKVNSTCENVDIFKAVFDIFGVPAVSAHVTITGHVCGLVDLSQGEACHWALCSDIRAVKGW